MTDIEAAFGLITDAATSRDGYVESMSIGQSGVVYPVDPSAGFVEDYKSYPYQPDRVSGDQGTDSATVNRIDKVRTTEKVTYVD